MSFPPPSVLHPAHVDHVDLTTFEDVVANVDRFTSKLSAEDDTSGPHIGRTQFAVMHALGNATTTQLEAHPDEIFSLYAALGPSRALLLSSDCPTQSWFFQYTLQFA